MSELSLRRALGEATDRLAAAGVPSPRADAEQLAAHVLGTPRGALGTVADLPRDAAARFSDLVGQRAARTPLQHLVGSVGFRHRELSVGAGVFIPRPETEVVAGWAIDWLGAGGTGARGPVVVDLCTGSGAIAAAIATEVPTATVHAVEIDDEAVAWARRNLHATGVHLHHADARDALPALDGQVDLVISNPPYVPVAERDLDPEVRDHDPALALWSGVDGLDMVRAVVRRSARLLRPGGALVVEHSDRQGETAPAILAAAGGWDDVHDHQDLTGRARFVTARKARP